MYGRKKPFYRPKLTYLNHSVQSYVLYYLTPAAGWQLPQSTIRRSRLRYSRFGHCISLSKFWLNIVLLGVIWRTTRLNCNSCQSSLEQVVPISHLWLFGFSKVNLTQVEALKVFSPDQRRIRGASCWRRFRRWTTALSRTWPRRTCRTTGSNGRELRAWQTSSRRTQHWKQIP